MSTVDTIVTAVPAARFEGLIITASDDELVVYDEAAKHIHHLNEVSSVIWRLCDGRRGVREIAVAATDQLGIEVGEDVVRLALRKLADARLLEGPLSADIRGTAQSRRSFMKKAAKYGAIAGPAIVSITAPLASASASGCTKQQCSNGNKESDCIQSGGLPGYCRNSPGGGCGCASS